MKRLMYEMHKRAYVSNELKNKSQGADNTDKTNIYHPTIKTNDKVTFISKGIMHLYLIITDK